MKWKYSIKVKHLFEDETTTELIIKLCLCLSPQFKSLKDKIEKSNILSDNKDLIIEELERIEDNFDFTRKLADGSIPKNEWANYSFNGDFEEEFNGNLSELYDLGDERVMTTIGLEKFICIT